MKWVDCISILTILLSGSTLLLVSQTGIISADEHRPSSVVLVDEDGRTVLLDTVLAVDDVGLIVGEEPGLPVLPLSPESTASSEPAMPDESMAVPPRSPPVPSRPCVNINSADERQLVTLRGIGPATAAAIIAYRDQHGAFRRKEDVKKVRGIGPAKFAQVVDDICL